MSRLYRMLSGAGEVTINRAVAAFAIVGILTDTLAGFFSASGRKNLSLKQIASQILFTGVDAMFLVGLIALSCGVIIAVQAITNMPQLGAGEYFGRVMVISVVRELGPFFTSLVVIGRSGAALAAYIGNMKVTKEIAALEAMGVNLNHYLVMPSFVGMIASMLCLNLYFDLIGVVGGLAVANVVVGVPFFFSLNEVLQALSVWDIVVSLFKGGVFGAAIAVISCFYGLSVENIRIVPRAVFRTVVGAMGTTIIINLIVTVVFYAILSRS